MTRQTSSPLQRMPLNLFNMPLTQVVHMVTKGKIDLDPPYQRGNVWTEDQRISLVYSWLIGATVPSIVLNDRANRAWTDRDAYDINSGGDRFYACIDGKQRLTTAVMWMQGELAVPASWFPESAVAMAENTEDGPYVRYTCLTDGGQAYGTDRTGVAIGIGEFGSVREEAAIYLLLNGGGTPQTDADMANAERVARGES